MANTGERREINRFAGAKESEAVRESKNLVSRTKELAANTEAKLLARRAGSKKRQSSRSR